MMMRGTGIRRVLAITGAFFLIAGGCSRSSDEPSEREATSSSGAAVVRMDATIPGWAGLHRAAIDTKLIRPQMREAFEYCDELLLRSIEESERWLRSQDAVARFAARDNVISRERILGSLSAFREILESSTSADEFVERIESDFEVLASRGDDENGHVFFTGYFAPEYAASRTPDEVFRFPVYRLPEMYRDEVLGGRALPDLTRRNIENTRLLDGSEIAWLDDDLNRYLLHVNGSGRLRFAEGSAICVSHIATNNHPYTSLGRLLIEAGYSTADEMSMQRIREIYNEDRKIVREFMLVNDRYVFFEPIFCDAWPRSSIGAALTPMRSVATDADAFPPGGLVFLHANIDDDSLALDQLNHFMLNQDTGGAIVGPGRCDVFVGTGDEAGESAGRLKAHGSLYYLLVKE